MGLEQLIQINISRETTGVTQAGFGTPMFLSVHSEFAERIRYYSSTDGVADDGFATSSDEYKAVSAALSQEKRPQLVAIGRQTADVAKVVTVTIVAVNTFNYQVTINGTTVSYLSDGSATTAEISAGLVSAINSNGTLSPIVTAADLVGSFTVTADVPGDDFTMVVSTNLTATITTDNEDITSSIQAIIDESDDWYLIATQGKTPREILKVAAYIEGKKKLYLACSADSDVITTATDDIASTLQAANYFRTAYLWNNDFPSFPEMAWAGLVLPEDPGSETWAFKTLAGITFDILTSTQIANLKAKNANYYIKIAGVSITLDGKTAGGEFIDVIRGIDWLQARMQERIYSRLVNSVKIPFTDGGAAIIETEIRAQLQEGIGRGFLTANPAPTVTVPLVAEVSSVDRANRLLPDVEFNAFLAGAIHAVNISGVISV